jgi:S1-C subfamily serine protease
MKKIIIFLAYAFIGHNIIAQNLFSEEDYKNYFKTNINKLNAIEGIWSVNVLFGSTIITPDFTVPNDNPTYRQNVSKVAIIKGDTKFDMRELNSSEKPVVFFEATASGIYLYRNEQSKTNSNAFLKNSETVLEYERREYGMNEIDKGFYLRGGVTEQRIDSWTCYKDIKFTFIKVFPNASDYDGSSKSSGSYSSSGTGFAISNSGYIVTNYHVIEGASSINVKGLNGNFNAKTKATVIASDKNNDLAILKLDNENLINGTIPYLISSKNNSVGSSVFALGYPLRATMGDEVKLTNGIISANSGFQGDITKYQISVPVQPGNSGGPLINSQGYLIGIVNAKHSETDNVSYAIKSTYLQSIVSSLPNNITLPQTNLLAGKTLSEQVQLVKKFVYIIEVE